MFSVIVGYLSQVLSARLRRQQVSRHRLQCLVSALFQSNLSDVADSHRELIVIMDSRAQYHQRIGYRYWRCGISSESTFWNVARR